MQIAAELARVTDQVWSSVLKLPIHGAPRTDTPDQRISITGRVRITSAEWIGALTVGCSDMLAARVARVVVTDDKGDLGLSRIEMAVGRVTELIADDAKSLVCESCTVSPAMVSEGADVVPMGTTPIAQVAFQCFSQPLLVTLAERNHNNSVA
jgi:hypothetical protein